jgi:hypothetical protein
VLQKGVSSRADGRILNARIICPLAVITLLLTIAGCGGKLANPGWASVTQVSPDGGIFLRYADGKADWKRIKRETMPTDMKTAIKHLNEPARFVETKRGSTLTFPGGDTLNYQEIIRD